MEVTQTDKAITLDCGCSVDINLTFERGELFAVQGSLNQCSLHRAAAKLLEALRGLTASEEVRLRAWKIVAGYHSLDAARAAIEEARK